MSDRWTTPADVERQVERLWSGGRLLAARLELPTDEATLFPLRLRLRAPTAREIGERFEDVRQWIRCLEEGSRAVRGGGYELAWEEINHRQVGRNRLPSGIVVPTLLDALGLVGKRRQADRFVQLAAATTASFPTLAGWLGKRPLVVLEHADDWGRVLAVLQWLHDHPRPGIYLRQLEIPGVDTKFIDAHRGLLGELLDLVLPPESIAQAASGARNFEPRYGLLAKPAVVRFRLLDPEQHVGPLSDLGVPATQFARLRPPAGRVFITENEINGLAFPDCADSLVIFGLGYGLERLGEIEWLREREVFYWGDLDTHGFAMLDRLRASLPAARSFLMDGETLRMHRELWTHEPARHDGALARLTEAERTLYDELRTDRWGPGVRLEQERIAFAWLKQALRALG